MPTERVISMESLPVGEIKRGSPQHLALVDYLETKICDGGILDFKDDHSKYLSKVSRGDSIDDVLSDGEVSYQHYLLRSAIVADRISERSEVLLGYGETIDCVHQWYLTETGRKKTNNRNESRYETIVALRGYLDKNVK